MRSSSNFSLKALGDFSDGTSGVDVTSEVMWTSGDTETALVTEGLVRALKAGTVTVTAKSGDVEATKEITISEAVLASLKVISKRTTLPIGHEAYLSLVAEYSDGTIVTDLTAEEWRSSAPEVATVDDGVVTGIAVGKATFTAVYGGLEADSKEMTIYSEVVELVIESDKNKVDLSDTLQLRLMARYDSGRTSHVTDEGKWSSDDDEIATVSDKGLVTGVKMGSVSAGL